MIKEESAAAVLGCCGYSRNCRRATYVLVLVEDVKRLDCAHDGQIDLSRFMVDTSQTKDGAIALVDKGVYQVVWLA